MAPPGVPHYGFQVVSGLRIHRYLVQPSHTIRGACERLKTHAPERIARHTAKYGIQNEIRPSAAILLLILKRNAKPDNIFSIIPARILQHLVSNKIMVQMFHTGRECIESESEHVPQREDLVQPDPRQSTSRKKETRRKSQPTP